MPYTPDLEGKLLEERYEFYDTNPHNFYVCLDINFLKLDP